MKDDDKISAKEKLARLLYRQKIGSMDKSSINYEFYSPLNKMSGKVT